MEFNLEIKTEDDSQYDDKPSSFDVKPEADSPHDDKPSTGMFAVYDATLSALTSGCASVVSCGSATESPCKLPISSIKVTGDVREGI